MSKQVPQVDTLFFHESVSGDYLAVVNRGGERVLKAKIELKETSAGPRPAKFRVIEGTLSLIHI